MTDQYDRKLAQRIMELVFEDARMTEPHQKALREKATTGEISKETEQDLEIIIREIISEWEV